MSALDPIRCRRHHRGLRIPRISYRLCSAFARLCTRWCRPARTSLFAEQMVPPGYEVSRTNDPLTVLGAPIVFGPFMQPELQSDFQERVDRLDNVSAITFDAHLETLMAAASGVVAMGGYNTFCEILSFDKPALIVPREIPRREQLIRASRAQELGLVAMLTEEGAAQPEVMATAIRQLRQQGRPSHVVLPGLLDGLENVNRLVRMHLAEGRHAARKTNDARQKALTVTPASASS